MDHPLKAYNANLVGVNFRPAEAKDLVKNLALGEALYLEREPDNQYDTNAVKVGYPATGTHLGYIERGMAESIAPWMDQGWAFHTTVVSILSDTKVLLKLEPFSPDEVAREQSA